MSVSKLRSQVREHLRERPTIQLAEAEALLVSLAVRQYRMCRLLIFGAGHDSAMWNDINAGGRTVFLEHNPNWIRQVTRGDASLDIRQVEYTTRITHWREWLNAAKPDTLKLPSGVDDASWDVILVDAPNGFAMMDEYPASGPIHGRMQSIEAARRLITPGGYIFVHDAQREVEAACSDRLLSRDGHQLFRFCMTKNNGKRTEMRCYFFAAPGKRVPLRARRLQFLSWWFGVRQIPDTQERVRATHR
jgi:uncharacterized protein (TIGR01627 family)